MIDLDDDIDVLKARKSPQEKYVIRPDAPVLPSLASWCECELTVKDNGMAAVFYGKKLPEEIHWIEYDIDLSMLTFVTWTGKVMSLGMKIHAPFRRYLRVAPEIAMIHMDENDKVVSIYPAKLVVRHIGF